jgi:hypothetical protein
MKYFLPILVQATWFLSVISREALSVPDESPYPNDGKCYVLVCPAVVPPMPCTWREAPASHCDHEITPHPTLPPPATPPYPNDGKTYELICFDVIPPQPCVWTPVEEDYELDCAEEEEEGKKELTPIVDPDESCELEEEEVQLPETSLPLECEEADALAPVECDGSNGWFPISIEGVATVYCVQEKLCVDETMGHCPGPRVGLPHGSICSVVRTGVLGCVPADPGTYDCDEEEAQEETASEATTETTTTVAYSTAATSSISTAVNAASRSGTSSVQAGVVAAIACVGAVVVMAFMMVAWKKHRQQTQEASDAIHTPVGDNMI